MPGNVTTRGGRKGIRNTWMLNQIGMYQYDNDPFGMLRKNEKSPMNAWWHEVIQHPGSPLYHPAMQFPFLTDLDVGGDVWDITSVGGGSLAIVDKHGGFARSTNGASDDDSQVYFSKGEIALPQDGGHIWVITTVMINTVLQADFFIGLCAKLGGGNLFDTRVDGIGFYTVDGSAELVCEGVASSAQETADPSSTLVDDTNVELAFIVTGNTRIDFYVDNLYVASITTGLPATELALAFGLRNGEASANYFDISTTQVLRD